MKEEEITEKKPRTIHSLREKCFPFFVVYFILQIIQTLLWIAQIILVIVSIVFLHSGYSIGTTAGYISIGLESGVIGCDYFLKFIEIFSPIKRTEALGMYCFINSMIEDCIQILYPLISFALASESIGSQLAVNYIFLFLLFLGIDNEIYSYVNLFLKKKIMEDKKLNPVIDSILNDTDCNVCYLPFNQNEPGLDCNSQKPGIFFKKKNVLVISYIIGMWSAMILIPCNGILCAIVEESNEELADVLWVICCIISIIIYRIEHNLNDKIFENRKFMLLFLNTNGSIASFILMIVSSFLNGTPKSAGLSCVIVIILEFFFRQFILMWSMFINIWCIKCTDCLTKLHYTDEEMKKDRNDWHRTGGGFTSFLTKNSPHILGQTGLYTWSYDVGGWVPKVANNDIKKKKENIQLCEDFVSFPPQNTNINNKV